MALLPIKVLVTEFASSSTQGLANGINFGLESLVKIISPILGGWMFDSDQYGPYIMTQVVLGVALCAGPVLYYFDPKKPEESEGEEKSSKSSSDQQEDAAVDKEAIELTTEL